LYEYLNAPESYKLSLTFDDAFESVFYNAYPMLMEKGFSFTVFPVTKYIGEYNRWEVNVGGRKFRHLNWRQLQEMNGCEVGSHTASHRCLTLLNNQQLIIELESSKKELEDRLGKEVRYLSLPFGRYNEKVIEAAQKAGYKAVCSLNPADREGGYVLGRYAVYLIDNLWSMSRKLGIGGGQNAEICKLKTINFFSGGTILAQKIFVK